MSVELPLHWFQQFGALTTPELQALQALGHSPQAYGRDRVIQREGAPSSNIFLLVDGWVAGSQMLPDGSRQILQVHVPGDAFETVGMSTVHTVEELRTLTPVLAVAVPFEQFGKLFETHPRLAASFMLGMQLDRLALMERLVSMGRTRAETRLSAFLLDLTERLEPLSAVKDGRWTMPLTQEQLGDVLGLTSVHVNRTLKSLEAQHLISQVSTDWAVTERRAMMDLAARCPREAVREPTWLPGAR